MGWAKNGDEVFWEEKKFHAASGKAQACTQGALLFSLLCFGGGGGDFFSKWANQIGFGPEFWHSLLRRANIPEASPILNYRIKHVWTLFFYISRLFDHGSTSMFGQGVGE